MHKTIFLAIIITVVSLLFCSAVAEASQPIKVTVDGQPLAMDLPPVVRDWRMLVPLRAISDAIGVNLHWNAAVGRITAWRTASGKSPVLLLYINNRTAWRGDLYDDFHEDFILSLMGYRVSPATRLPLRDVTTKNGSQKITLETPPVLIGNRAMVPLRVFAEGFDVTVRWHPETRTVSIVTGSNHPSFVVQPPVQQRQKLSSEEVAARVRPAVVRIDTQRGHGSGFFVSPDGLVLTNAHVVRGSNQIVVVTNTGERFSATVEKITNWHDLALLRVSASPHVRFSFIRDNPAARGVQPGEEVLAFGSPLGLAGTVTRGIVSAWQVKDVTFGAWKNNNIRVIQHDAAIAPGNSGGPLVNLYGEWVGVNTLVRIDWAGFSFAVPAERYHSLILQGQFSLRCDWFSYYTEEYSWREVYKEASRLLDEALAIQAAGARAERLNRYVLALQAIRQIAANYQPFSPEIQNLHRLYLNRLDAEIAVWTFSRDSWLNPWLWTQSAWDVLRNNFTHTQDVYISEWNAISARFQ